MFTWGRKTVNQSFLPKAHNVYCYYTFAQPELFGLTINLMALTVAVPSRGLNTLLSCGNLKLTLESVEDVFPVGRSVRDVARQAEKVIARPISPTAQILNPKICHFSYSSMHYPLDTYIEIKSKI